jgi:hypothetical protein
MHDQNHEHLHIPPPDLPHKKKGFRIEPPHVIIGALVLVGILLIYILLLAKAGV